MFIDVILVIQLKILTVSELIIFLLLAPFNSFVYPHSAYSQWTLFLCVFVKNREVIPLSFNI